MAVEVDDVTPLAMIRPTRIYTNPNLNIIIDCHLKNGNPLITKLQWSKNNINIEPDNDKIEILVIFYDNNDFI